MNKERILLEAMYGTQESDPESKPTFTPRSKSFPKFSWLETRYFPWTHRRTCPKEEASKAVHW
ncbi:MAG: hypothetical protein IPG58_15775 [Acidobacteria bacterium]|nr:hypothetical protein [Acidobacteriota bacterium]